MCLVIIIVRNYLLLIWNSNLTAFPAVFSSSKPLLKKVLVFCQLTDAVGVGRGSLKDYTRQLFFFPSWFLMDGQSLYQVSRLPQPVLVCGLPPASVTLSHSQYSSPYITESGNDPRNLLSPIRKVQMYGPEYAWFNSREETKVLAHSTFPAYHTVDCEDQTS